MPAPGNIEVERKFRVTDAAPLRRRLEKLDAVWGQPQRQVDRYFAHPSRDFARTDEALRIRSAGDANQLTYKGPKLDATSKTRREIELALAGGPAGAEACAALLAALGFRRVADVNKLRATAMLDFRGRRFSVSIDEVDHLGTFIELETLADETTWPAARHDLDQLAAELELNEGERRSYLELLLDP